MVGIDRVEGAEQFGALLEAARLAGQCHLPVDADPVGGVRFQAGQHFLQAPPYGLLGVEAGCLLETPVGGDDDQVGRRPTLVFDDFEENEAGAHVFEQLAVGLLGFEQVLLDPLALGDVFDQADEKPGLAPAVAHQADFQVPPETAGVGPQILLVALEAFDVSGQQAGDLFEAALQFFVRREIPPGFVEQGLRRHAEQFAETLVGAQDAAARGDDGHAGRGQFEGRRVVIDVFATFLGILRREAGRHGGGAQRLGIYILPHNRTPRAGRRVVPVI